jgi:hypothetical protein
MRRKDRPEATNLRRHKIPELPKPSEGPFTIVRSGKSEQEFLDSIPRPRAGAKIAFHHRRSPRRLRVGIFVSTTQPAKASWRITDAGGNLESIAVSDLVDWAYADGS